MSRNRIIILVLVFAAVAAGLVAGLTVLRQQPSAVQPQEAVQAPEAAGSSQPQEAQQEGDFAMRQKIGPPDASQPPQAEEQAKPQEAAEPAPQPAPQPKAQASAPAKPRQELAADNHAAPQAKPHASTEPKPTAPEGKPAAASESKPAAPESKPQAASESKPQNAEGQAKAGKTRTLSSVSASGGSADLTVTAAVAGGVPSFKYFMMDNPGRLVVDLPGRYDYAGDKEIAVKGSLASQVRVGPHPDMIRLVIDLASGVQSGKLAKPDIQKTGDGLTITLHKAK